MKHTHIKIIIIFLFSFYFTSCETNNITYYEEIDLICAHIPSNWRCKIYTEDFDSIEYMTPHYLNQTPIAIAHFKNLDIQFLRYDSSLVFQPFFIYYFDINEIESIEHQIDSMRAYSHCIPMYFDETKKCYIVANACHYYDRWFDDMGVRENQPLIDSLHTFFRKY